MDIKALLCMLLSTVCHAVTSIESDPNQVTRPGPDKKAEAMKGVGVFLDDAASRGAQVARDLAERVAGTLIDHTVAAANDLGAFTHKDTTAAGSSGAR